MRISTSAGTGIHAENASHLLDVGMEVIEFSSDEGWQWVLDGANASDPRVP